MGQENVCLSIRWIVFEDFWIKMFCCCWGCWKWEQTNQSAAFDHLSLFTETLWTRCRRKVQTHSRPHSYTRACSIVQLLQYRTISIIERADRMWRSANMVGDGGGGASDWTFTSTQWRAENTQIQTRLSFSFIIDLIMQNICSLVWNWSSTKMFLIHKIKLKLIKPQIRTQGRGWPESAAGTRLQSDFTKCFKTTKRNQLLVPLGLSSKASEIVNYY